MTSAPNSSQRPPEVLLALATLLAAACLLFWPAELGGARHILRALGALGLLGAALYAALRARERMRAQGRVSETLLALSHALAGASSEPEVVRAVESAARRAFAAEYVELVLEPGKGDSGVQRVRSDSGKIARTNDGDVHAALELAGRNYGALYLRAGSTPLQLAPDEKVLLSALANTAALAIDRARSSRKLAEQDQHAHAWRGQREALLETVAAEIAHEVRYPINFFRSLFERAAPGRTLDVEEVEIGREEVERLERLVAGLRRVATQKQERARIRVADLCARACALLGDERPVPELDLSQAPGCELSCDVHQATQVLVNLLTNARDAAGASGQIGVQLRATGAGAELSVWDTGPGFSEDPARLFAPWFTTKLRGTGLGLAITQRLVRAHGWSIRASRAGSRTVFTIAIRPDDVRLEPPRAERSRPRAEVA